MKQPWQAGPAGEPQQVLCDFNSDGLKTTTIHPEDWPIGAWRVAQLMNDAFAMGYRQAQADIRHALGAQG